MISLFVMFGFADLVACSFGDCDPSLPGAECGDNVSASGRSGISLKATGYTGPELKMPMQPGDLIRCNVEAGGVVAEILHGGIDSWHTDANNGYYAIDF